MVGEGLATTCGDAVGPSRAPATLRAEGCGRHQVFLGQCVQLQTTAVGVAPQVASSLPVGPSKTLIVGSAMGSLGKGFDHFLPLRWKTKTRFCASTPIPAQRPRAWPAGSFGQSGTTECCGWASAAVASNRMEQVMRIAHFSFDTFTSSTWADLFTARVIMRLVGWAMPSLEKLPVSWPSIFTVMVSPETVM